MKEKCSKEDFYNEVIRLYDLYGDVTKDIFNEHSVIHGDFHHYCTRFGGIKNIMKELGLSKPVRCKHTKESILNDGEQLLDKHGYINKELCVANGISISVVKRLFGNFTNFFNELGYDNNFYRNVELKDLLADVDKFIKENGLVSCKVYRKYGAYSQPVIDRFGGWKTVVRMLGYEPLAETYGKDEIAKYLKELVDKYGYLSRELVDENCPFTYQAVTYHFGSMRDICDYFGNPNLFKYGVSQNERLIDAYLTEIIGRDNYETQKTWDWLRSEDTGRRLKVDFYIPSLNTVIEYDGQQHYIYNDYFYKSEEDFERCKRYDELKDKLLKEHGISVVRIPYTTKVTLELVKSICKQI